MTTQNVSALPFTMKRTNDVFGVAEYSSTTETVHGLLRIHQDDLIIQWRVHRSTDRFGKEVRSDMQVDPVREVAVPLTRIANASIRRLWWERHPRLVLTAADLTAFEELAGAGGLSLAHPAELVLTLRRGDRLTAREFATDLELAAGDLALDLEEAEEDARQLPPSGTSGTSR